MSITARAAIQKGKDLENYLATTLRAKGMDMRAVRAHGSGNGNGEKSDIWTSVMVLGQNAGFECKHYSSLSIMEWWRQTKKLEKLGREPVLVFKQTHDTYEDTKVVIYLDTFLELVKQANGAPALPAGASPDIESGESREKKWAVQNAISALKKLEKFL